MCIAIKDTKVLMTTKWLKVTHESIWDKSLLSFIELTQERGGRYAGSCDPNVAKNLAEWLIFFTWVCNAPHSTVAFAHLPSGGSCGLSGSRNRS